MNAVDCQRFHFLSSSGSFMQPRLPVGMDRNGTVLDEGREIEIGLREIRSCGQGIANVPLANLIFGEYRCMDDPGG